MGAGKVSCWNKYIIISKDNDKIVIKFNPDSLFFKNLSANQR